MSKRELIVTNTVWYKIKNFLKRLLKKTSNYYEKHSIKTKKDNNEFMKNISYRNELINLNTKKEIAEKLMNGQLNIIDLSNNEVNEMIEYFNIYISEINQKLSQIKKSIIGQLKYSYLNRRISM